MRGYERRGKRRLRKVGAQCLLENVPRYWMDRVMLAERNVKETGRMGKEGYTATCGLYRLVCAAQAKQGVEKAMITRSNVFCFFMSEIQSSDCFVFVLV